MEDLITLESWISFKDGLDRVGNGVQYDQEADETNETGILVETVADVHQADMLDTVKTRTRHLTKKGKKYQKEAFFEKRMNLYVRIMIWWTYQELLNC